MGIDIRTVESDADYEAWRRVRLAVLPNERCPGVAELQAIDRPERVLLLAELDGELAGSGLADVSDLADCASIVPRVLPGLRRRGVGGALLAELARIAPDKPFFTSSVEDSGSLVFAERHGFAEVDRQIEQVRDIDIEALPDLPIELTGLTVLAVAERPELWTHAYHGLVLGALDDFAVDRPMRITLEQWQGEWAGTPEATFLALDGDEPVGTAGLYLDPDEPDRAEHTLTAVRRDWRGRGVASYLKRLTLFWASQHELREVYTWTQRGNDAMRSLNANLGYTTRAESISVRRPAPLG